MIPLSIIYGVVNVSRCGTTPFITSFNAVGVQLVDKYSPITSAHYVSLLSLSLEVFFISFKDWEWFGLTQIGILVYWIDLWLFLFVSGCDATYVCQYRWYFLWYQGIVCWCHVIYCFTLYILVFIANILLINLVKTHPYPFSFNSLQTRKMHVYENQQHKEINIRIKT